MQLCDLKKSKKIAKKIDESQWGTFSYICELCEIFQCECKKR